MCARRSAPRLVGEVVEPAQSHGESVKFVLAVDFQKASVEAKSYLVLCTWYCISVGKVIFLPSLELVSNSIVAQLYASDECQPRSPRALPDRKAHVAQSNERVTCEVWWPGELGVCTGQISAKTMHNPPVVRGHTHERIPFVHVVLD